MIITKISKVALKFIFLTSLITLASCQNPITKAVRGVEYSAYELVGIQKRDLLKTRVSDAGEEQKEAGEKFQDALQQLKKVYGFDGGDLEKKYNLLKSSYDRAFYQAEAVHKSIRKVENVAGDLFREWDKEIDQIETASLKQKSRDQLSITQRKYADLHSRLKASEAQMDPVLRKLNDNVLYLKHNLNAKAIASLKNETRRIENEIENLVRDMNKSIESTERFIKEIP